MKKVILSILLVLLMNFGAYAQVYQTDLILTKPGAVWVDSRSYNGLSSLLTAIGSDETTIYIAQQEDFTGTIPDNVRLKFLTGGSINATGPVTINAKSIDAPNIRIFYGSGAYDFASGIELKSAWFENFDEVVSETSDDEVTIIMSQSETATTNASLGNDVVLRWDSPGNELTISSGIIISNVDKIIAGDYQIVSGDGRFDFNDGVVLKSTWFSALNEAGRHIDDTVVTLEVRDMESISYDYTFGSNITLHFYDSISIGAGKTITIYSPENIVAQPTQQIFSGDGSISFTNGGVVYPEWWQDNTTPGTTDMTSALQAAVDSLSTGFVQLNGSTYLIDAVTLDSNVYLIGSGRGVSVIKQKTAGVTLLTATSESNIVIKDIEFDGDNKGTSYSGWSGEDRAIELVECNNVWIQDCYIHDFTNQGIYINIGDGSPKTTHIYVERNEIADIGVRNTSLNTPYSSPPNAGAFIPISVGDSFVTSNGLGDYIYIKGNNIHGVFNTLVSITGSDYVYVEDNELYDMDTNAIQYGTYARYGYIRSNICYDFTGLGNPTVEGRGISIHDTGNENDFEIFNNTVDDAPLYGIDGRCPHTRIVGNKITNTSQSSNQTSSAGIVVIGDNADDVEIIDNEVYNSYARGIYVLASDGVTISRCRIINNKITSSGNQQINIGYSGTGNVEHTVIESNQVYNGAKSGIAVSKDLDFIVSNNTILDNDTGGNSEYGISIFGNAQGMVIGNTVSGSGHDYGLKVASGSVVWAQDNDFHGNVSPISGDVNLIHKTSNYTLVERDVMLGWIFTNKGDADTLVLTLPPAKVGMKVGFIRLANFTMRIDPDGTETIMGGGAGKYLELDTTYDSAFLQCVTNGRWEIVTSYGTLAYEP